jgi:hypothetical protein
MEGLRVELRSERKGPIPVDAQPSQTDVCPTAKASR